MHALYLVQKSMIPVSGETSRPIQGGRVIDYVKPGLPVGRAGIKPGDTMVSCNSVPVEEWLSGWYGQKAGDTLTIGVLKNGRATGVPVVTVSSLSVNRGFFWSFFIIICLVSMSSLYLLYKKPGDRSTMLFFLFIQLSAVLAIGEYINIPDPFCLLTAVPFLVSTAFVGPVLVHFHLSFPWLAKILVKNRRFILFPYLAGLVLGILYASDHIRNVFFNPSAFQPVIFFDRVLLWWMTINFTVAMGIAVYRMLTIHETLARNQLRIVVTGTFFGTITSVIFTLFFNRLFELWDKYPNLLPLCGRTGTLIMIFFILVAIFRYRVWDIEVIIRKVLLYLGATMLIVLSYLLLIWIVDRLVISKNDFIRYLVFGVSVMVFLVLRDRIQRLVDRIFHREHYDSATVISGFEAELAGSYRKEELVQKIVHGLDRIFHFNFFVFFLRKEDRTYEPVGAIGTSLLPEISSVLEITPEMDARIRGSKVFSVREISDIPIFLESFKSDLVVPLVSAGQPQGFFLCGQKKSERVYTGQDINVLMLLAKRVVALLHTAGLYQKDLDRQLMLERERARISRDMHDEIGAGLTKIAMMIEAPEMDVGYGMRVKMNRIASSARDMIARLNVIVWALNPKYDNLDSLISYLRRYFGEYLENFSIRFNPDFPEQVPDLAITPDTRRNLFYAVQEAVHNAVKHSGSAGIDMIIRIGSQKLEIEILDNGKGFDHVRQGSGGNGLQNMKKRAEDMGGTFEIHSSPGQGTRIFFSVPL